MEFDLITFKSNDQDITRWILFVNEKYDILKYFECTYLLKDIVNICIDYITKIYKVNILEYLLQNELYLNKRYSLKIKINDFYQINYVYDLELNKSKLNSYKNFKLIFNDKIQTIFYDHQKKIWSSNYQKDIHISYYKPKLDFCINSCDEYILDFNKFKYVNNNKNIIIYYYI
jgi:hypothetical protein